MTDKPLLQHTASSDSDAARVELDLSTRGDPVEPFLFGKFSEHLGLNIYHGMEAQILFNPTFGEYHFRGSERMRSGGFVSENDQEKIAQAVENHERYLAYPEETDGDALLDAYCDGLAFGWTPTGDAEVTSSPDTGETGNRAQRVQFEDGTGGVRQETKLPLHRVREFEFRVKARAADATTLTLSLGPTGGDALATADVDVDDEWSTVEGTLAFPDGADVDEDGIFEVALTGDGPANVVVERVLLYPADHVDYADPEIVAFLRDSDLPLLRWPGGNFVSGYDWRDGVGPVDERPTRINRAWGGLEYNLFGTDEFVEFCENVGCEPSLCINAGDGTPEEAAAWVEYCNGSTDTEMGALRAEHGHPEPYDITYWEIGNELYGPWQVRWTTPEGNADRYRRFREAMLDADPDILVSATGLETNSDGHWNDVILEECGEDVRAISDHILGGGQVGPETDPDELFHAFMGFSDQLGREFEDLRQRMLDAGVEDPKLDVTELQLFAHYQADDAEGMGREGGPADQADADVDGQLTQDTMPTPVTISEALYNASIRHEFIRMGSFVEMLTHSATVNHGGGLQKSGERVWADPCHYGRSMGTALAGGTPVGVELECDTISTEESFREIEPVSDVPAVDAMAVVDEDESTLTVMLVNRASRDDPVSVSLDVGEFDAGDEAEVVTLAADEMYEANSREDPEHVVPETGSLSVDDGRAELDLQPYSLVRLTVPKAE